MSVMSGALPRYFRAERAVAADESVSWWSMRTWSCTLRRARIWRGCAGRAVAGGAHAVVLAARELGCGNQAVHGRCRQPMHGRLPLHGGGLRPDLARLDE